MRNFHSTKWRYGFLVSSGAPSFDWLREKLTVTKLQVGCARTSTETSTSKLPPLLRGWERPSLYRGPHSRSSHPARVTDSLDSSRNERIHRRHLRHRYVTRVARPHRGRVASSPRRALGALCLPDRICSLSSGFYSFSVGASRARFARYLGQPRPSPRRRWIRCSRHDVESDRVRIRGERRVPCSSALS